MSAGRISAADFAAVMALVNWNIGAAIYTFPSLYVAFGGLATSAALAGCATLSIFVYHMLDLSSAGLPKAHFIDVVRVRLGILPAQLLAAMVVCSAVGVFTGYFDIVQRALNQWLGQTLGLLSLVFLLVIAVAFASYGGVDEIPLANELANLAVVLLVLGLVWLRAVAGPDDQATVFPEPGEAPARATFVQLFDMCVFAFSSAEVYMTLDAPARRPVVAVGSIALSLSLYVLVGALGASVLVRSGLGGGGRAASDDVLDAFQGRGAVGVVVVGANLVSLMLSLPVFMVTARSYLEKAVPVAAKLPPAVSSAAFAAAALAVNHFASGLMQLLATVAAFTDVSFMLVFPPLVLLRSPRGRASAPAIRAGAAAVLALGATLTLRSAWELCA